MKVQTTAGLVDKRELDVRDIVSTDDHSRVIATEWRLAGEIVRRDVWVNGLRGLEIGAASGR